MNDDLWFDAEFVAILYARKPKLTAVDGVVD